MLDEGGGRVAGKDEGTACEDSLMLDEEGCRVAGKDKGTAM